MAVTMQPIGAASDKLSAVTARLEGMSAEELQSYNKEMTPISPEELAAIHEAQRNAPRTVYTDSDEFITDYYSTGDDVTYEVDGVTFTNQEMEGCKEVMKAAVSCLKSYGSSLDYSDYAKMGLAEAMVNTYAKENLTDEQAKVFTGALSSYIDGLIASEKQKQEEMGCYLDTSGSLGEYYALRAPANELIVNSIEDLIARTPNLPQETKDTLLANAKLPSVLVSATNDELSSSIRELFANVDLNSSSSLSNAYSKYKTLITPAYTAYGLYDNSRQNSLTYTINSDVSSFAELAAKYKAAASSLNITA